MRVFFIVLVTCGAATIGAGWWVLKSYDGRAAGHVHRVANGEESAYQAEVSKFCTVTKKWEEKKLSLALAGSHGSTVLYSIASFVETVFGWRKAKMNMYFEELCDIWGMGDGSKIEEIMGWMDDIVKIVKRYVKRRMQMVESSFSENAEQSSDPCACISGNGKSGKQRELDCAFHPVEDFCEIAVNPVLERSGCIAPGVRPFVDAQKKQVWIKECRVNNRNLFFTFLAEEENQQSLLDLIARTRKVPIPIKEWITDRLRQDSIDIMGEEDDSTSQFRQWIDMVGSEENTFEFIRTYDAHQMYRSLALDKITQLYLEFFLPGVDEQERKEIQNMHLHVVKVLDVIADLPGRAIMPYIYRAIGAFYFLCLDHLAGSKAGLLYKIFYGWIPVLQKITLIANVDYMDAGQKCQLAYYGTISNSYLYVPVEYEKAFQADLWTRDKWENTPCPYISLFASVAGQESLSFDSKFRYITLESFQKEFLLGDMTEACAKINALTSKDDASYESMTEEKVAQLAACLFTRSSQRTTGSIRSACAHQPTRLRGAQHAGRLQRLDQQAIGTANRLWTAISPFQIKGRRLVVFLPRWPFPACAKKPSKMENQTI